MIEYLKEKEVDLNIQDNDGCYPIHTAAMAGHKDVIEELHKAGIDINQINKKDKRTPLAYAAQNGHIDAVHKIAELCPEVDKDFALFIAGVNGYMSKNGVSETKMLLINETLNSILVDKDKKCSQKIDAFLGNSGLMIKLNRHKDIRKYIQDNKFYQYLRGKFDKNLIGNTASFKAFNAFKEQYRNQKAVEAEAPHLNSQVHSGMTKR